MFSKQKVAVGLAIPPKPPIGALKQTIWASRALRLDCLLLWDHLQDIFPSSLWDRSFNWTAADNASPHEFFEQQTLLGFMGPRVGGMRTGVAVTDPIRRHPVVIAQAMVSLAHITKKAPILGIGAGERENVSPYGLPFTHTVSRVEEALQLIRMCLDETGPLNYEGAYYRLDNAVFDLRPPRGKKPLVWVGALGQRMLELTGRYGDGWYPVGLMSAAEYGEKLAVVRAAAKAAGRDASAIVPSLQPYMVVAPTREEAESMLKSKTIRFFGLLAPAASWTAQGFSHPFGDEFRGFIDFLPETYSRTFLEEAIASVPDEMANAGLFIGTPKEIATQLKPYADAGMRHVVPQAMSAALSRKHALYSMRALRTIRAELNS